MSDITVNNFKAFYEQIRPYLGSAHSGFTPVGTVISLMGKTAPQNYLACDGTVYNISDYPELAAYFTAQFEAANYFGGDGTTTFAVPDLRGEFLRGAGTNSHANQGSGGEVGEHQDATLIPQVNYNAGHINFASGQGFEQDYDHRTIVSSGNRSGTQQQAEYVESNSARAYTTRPTNTSVLYCISTKNIFMDAGMNFSTEEQVVGTWIDGKPLYQITVDCGIFSSTTKEIPFTITNFKHLVNIFGAYTASNNVENASLPFVSIYDNYSVELSLRDNNRILIRTKASDGGVIGSQMYVTLQYTKTTDA